MSFNLIREAWIPARSVDGARTMLAPWQVTAGIGPNLVVALDAPRPDFNGALIQFLIGLVQTALAPKDDRAWRKWLSRPPDEAALKAGMEPFAHAFDLDGPGPRFMQESALQTDKKAKTWPVSYLLIDAPTENTRKEDRDHFVKRQQFEDDKGEPKPTCLPCAAAALFTWAWLL